MKRSVIAAFSSALIALGAIPIAKASTIDFGVTAVDGSISYTGSSLDQSTVLDLDLAFLAVTEIASDDSSGLAIFSPVELSALTNPPSTQIIYTSGPGPLGADVILSWPTVVGPGTDMFTETLTTVMSINRATGDQIGLTLTGTLSDTDGIFTNAPVLLILTASQANEAIQVSFTNTSTVTPSVPEPATWVLLVLGFGALGYAGLSRQKTPALSA